MNEFPVILELLITDKMTIFSLLSLNTFGVPFYLSLRRIKRLSDVLNRIAPTILCLQEIQQNAYLPLLQKGLSSYSHHAYFRNRYAPKGGLFTASLPAFPVLKSDFFPYPNQGRPLSIGFSDWALNKGILQVNLEVDGGCLIILNTHLHANYRADWRLSNKLSKIQSDQIQFLAELIHTQPADAWVIVCGDFNFPRQAPAYQQMLRLSSLTDAFANDQRPTYLPFPLVSKKWHTSLDYIFYRAPAGETGEVVADIVPIFDSNAKLPIQRFLTDHHALALSIR